MIGLSIYGIISIKIKVEGKEISVHEYKTQIEDIYDSIFNYNSPRPIGPPPKPPLKSNSKTGFSDLVTEKNMTQFTKTTSSALIDRITESVLRSQEAREPVPVQKTGFVVAANKTRRSTHNPILVSATTTTGYTSTSSIEEPVWKKPLPVLDTVLNHGKGK